MSNIVTDKIIPDSGSANTLTVGGTGDSVVVLDSLNVNTLQDAGGNNIFVSNGSGTVTSKNSGVSGGMNLISTQTASGASSVSFTSGLDSTYDVYVFKYNLHLAGANASLQLEGSSNTGGAYGVTKTTTFFRAKHNESDSEASLDYMTGYDRSQSTSFQWMSLGANNDADGILSGELYLFNPSSTTYVKQFYGRTSETGYADPSPYAYDNYYAGYFNTTSVIDAIKMTPGSSTVTGTVKMYGL